MNFNTEEKTIDSVTTEINFTVPVETFNQEYEKAISKISREAKIKGFRPGKAPRSMIEKLYAGKTRFEVIDEITKSVINETAQKLERRQDLIAAPEVAFDSLNPAEPIKFSAVFSFFPRPEVNLPAQIKLKDAPKPPQVGEAEVDKAVKQMLASKAELTEITDRTKAKKGDVVTGKLHEQLADSDDYTPGEALNTALGDNIIPEELEAKLIGSEVGKDKTFKIKFAEDHKYSQLAGKEISYKFVLDKIQDRKLPEMTDELAKTVGLGEVENVAQMREKLSELITKENKKTYRDQVVSAVISQLREENQFDIPQAMVKQEVKALLTNQQTGEEPKPEAVDAADEELLKLAQERIQAGIILMKVAESEKITATREDINAHVETMAAQSGMDVEIIKQAYLQDKDIVGRLQSELTTDKVYEFLISRVSEQSIKDFLTPEKLSASAKSAAPKKEKKTAKKSEVTKEEQPAEKATLAADKKPAAKKFAAGSAKQATDKPVRKESAAKSATKKKASAEKETDSVEKGAKATPKTKKETK